MIIADYSLENENPIHVTFYAMVQKKIVHQIVHYQSLSV